MEEVFDNQTVPYNFLHCFNRQCPKSEKCLRHLTAVHSTNQSPTLYVVNPNCIPEDANECSYFLSNQQIRMAWGISHLLDNVPHKNAASLKSLMISHFGRNLYYRFYRKEASLDPEQQEYIRKSFRQKGGAGEPVFDAYTQEYKW